MTIVEDRPVITGGVDTHADVHVAAALDPIGGLLGVRQFPATAAGYADLLEWLGEFGTVTLVGIEGAGSYGAGLARCMADAGVRVVEVDRADRQDRHRQGKSDPLDAVSAARAAQSGRASGTPKGRDGAVEAIRALMVAKRSARNERTQAINQAGDAVRCMSVPAGPQPPIRADSDGHRPRKMPDLPRRNLSAWRSRHDTAPSSRHAYHPASPCPVLLMYRVSAFHRPPGSPDAAAPATAAMNQRGAALMTFRHQTPRTVDARSPAVDRSEGRG
jgi:hypothetical protein